jgi:hypothetical protein
MVAIKVDNLAFPPLRIMAFATMAANLTLVAWITRRIARSRLAGAVVCWAANPAVVPEMLSALPARGSGPAHSLRRDRRAKILVVAAGGFHAWIRRA